MTDKPYGLNLDGHPIGVFASGDRLTIAVPGVLELTIDRESAVAIAKAIYAKATRMTAEQAHEFFGELAGDVVRWQ